MSDTPRTDAEYQQWETLEEAARFSQELERENAALREELEYAIKAGAKREAELLVMLGKEAQP